MSAKGSVADLRPSAACARDKTTCARPKEAMDHVVERLQPKLDQQTERYEERKRLGL